MRRWALRSTLIILTALATVHVASACGGGSGGPAAPVPDELGTWDAMTWDEDTWE